MVGIFTGNGTGIERSSAMVLGSRGLLGQANLGRGGENVYVNAANGNLLVQNTDEILLGLGLSGTVTRSYNHQAATVGTTPSDDWQAGVSRRVYNLVGTLGAVNSTVTRTDWDGSETVYKWNTTQACYLSQEGAGSYDKLVYSSNHFGAGLHAWLWTDGDSRVTEVYDVSNSGRVVSSSDLGSNDLGVNTRTFTYDVNGRISRVTTANGEYVEFIYADNKLVRLETNYNADAVTGLEKRTRIYYGYDEAGHLTTVKVDLTPDDNTEPNEDTAPATAYTTRYGYDANHRLISITQDDGSGITIAYTSTGNKVEYIYQTSAQGVTRTTQFLYDVPAAGKTTIRDAGLQDTVLTYNATGQLTRIDAPAAYSGGPAQFSSFVYNTGGDVTSYSPGTSTTFTSTYDTTTGLKLSEEDTLGNTTKWAYGTKNELLRETRFVTPGPSTAEPAGPMVTRYVYDSKNLLRFVVSAEGRVTEHQYTGILRTKTIEYTDNFYDVDALAETADLDLATLTGWRDLITDKTTRRLTLMSYDFRGSLSRVQTFGVVNSSGDGAGDSTDTYYFYDQVGRLLKRYPAGSTPTEIFSYDGLNRITSSTDLNGVTTSIEFQDQNETSRQSRTIVTLANGLTQTSVFNAAGELISFMESGVGVTSATKTYKYDSLGNLRVSTDATGVSTYFVYDHNRRLVGEVQADGSVTEYKYDARGRMHQTVRYKTPTTAFSSLVDVNGDPLSVEMSAIRPAADTADVWEWRLYDNGGRLIEIIDGRGGATIYAYDGASRLVSETRYHNVLTAAAVTGYKTTHPTSLRIPTLSAANDRVVRYYYDDDGRQIGKLDGEGYFSVNIYNAAGELTETIAYADKPDSALWATGTFTQLRNSALQPTDANSRAVHNWFLYDRRGLMRASIDGEGNLSRFAYNALGQMVSRYVGETLSVATLLATPPTLSGLGSNPSATAAGIEFTTYTYDPYGRMLSETRTLAGGATETDNYQYDFEGKLLKATRATGLGGRTLIQEYDKQGRLIRELSGEGAKALADLGGSPTQTQINTVYATWGTRYEYDLAGRLKLKIEPDGTGTTGRTTLYYYNTDGALAYQISALGEVVEYRYDAVGRQTDVVQYAKRLASGVLSGLGGGLVTAGLTSAVAAIADADNDSKTSLAYNLDNTVSQTTDAKGAVTSFTYNGFDELLTQVDPIVSGTTRTTTRAYDRRGLMTSTILDSVAGGLQITELNEYDAFGQVTKTTDALGRFRYATYDRAYRLKTTTDTLSGVVSYSYDGRGKVTQEDRFGSVTTFTYDQFSRQVVMSAPGNITITTLFNAHGETTQVTDAEGRDDIFTYDRNGALLTSSNDLGLQESRAYDKAGRLIEVTDANGAKIAYTYDASDRVLTKVVDPGGLNLTTTYTHYVESELANDKIVTRVTDPAGVVTETTFDRNGNTTAIVVDPGGLALRTEYTYDQRNRVLTMVEAAGTAQARTTAYTYDKADRLTKTVVNGVPTGSNITTEYGYDKAGNLVAVKDALGKITRFLYDSEDRQVLQVDATGGVTKTTYDAEGRVLSTIGYVTALTTTVFNALPAFPAAMTGEPTIVAAANDHVSYLVYDAAGRVGYEIDGLGYVTKYGYDRSNNITSKTRYAAPISPSAYDLATIDGLVAALSTTNVRIDRAVYDGGNRLVYDVAADGAVTAYGYDANGNIIQERRLAALYTTAGAITKSAMDSWVAGLSAGATAADRYSRAAYDKANRQVFSVDAAGRVIRFTYDAMGRATKAQAFKDTYTTVGTLSLTAMTDWAGSHSNAATDRISRTYYDADGRARFSVDALGYVVESVYDALGNVTSRLERADAFTVTDATATAAQMATLVGAATATTRATGFAYDAVGRLTDVTDAEGYVTHFDLDAMGQATLISTAYGLSAQLSTTLRAYDAVGRVTSETRANNVAAEATTTVYAYDGQGQLTQVTAASGTPDAAVTALAYDKRGLVASQTRAPTQGEQSITSFGYNAFGEQTAVTTGQATTERTYDVMGRIKTEKVALRTESGSTVWAIKSYDYNAFGNMVKVTDPRNQVGYFYYDALDRLVLQTDPERYATKTDYSLDAAGREITTVTRFLVQSGVGFNETTQPVLSTNAADKAITSLLRDRLGRVISTTDAMNATESYTLDAFGNRLTVTNKKNAVTTYTYDKRGLVLTEVLPISSTNANGVVQATSVTNKFTYDARGNRTQSIEAFGLTEARTTNYTYDRLDRLVGQTSDAVQVINETTLLTAGGTVTPTETIKYDRRGNMIETINAAGARTLYFYDDLDRKIGEVDALGQFKVWTYDDRSNALTMRAYDTAITLPANGGTPLPSPVGGDTYRETLFTYDRNNRLVESRIAGVRTGYYDTTTSTFITTASADLVSTRQYDAAGNLVVERVMTAGGASNAVFHYYDLAGREVAKVDQENYLTVWVRDSEGNVTSETRYANKITAAFTEATAVSTLSSGLASSNDRVTLFTYDKNGRRETEARQGVVAHVVDAATGVMTANTVTVATITYTYDGLGNVTSKTEANKNGAYVGDSVTYTYDGLGRQTGSTYSGFTDYLNVTNVQRQTETAYDGLGNLTRSSIHVAGSTSNERVTKYTYGAGGRLATVTDAEGFVRTYGYDAAGHVVKESYSRLKSDGTTSLTEANAIRYDLMGRAIFSAAASYNGSAWSFGDKTHIRYNVHGEVTGKGITPGSATTPVYQETYEYDKAGRMWRTNTGDGSVKLFMHDYAGNVSLTITSAGTDLASKSLAQAVIDLTPSGIATIGAGLVAGITPTIARFDKRGQQVETRQTFREIKVNASNPNVNDTGTIVTKKAYNAFGEVTKETDAYNNDTDFLYNTLGKVIEKKSPQVAVTSETGQTTNVRPTETYYYDLSGRLVGVRDANNNLTTRALLAHTGHGETEALVTGEFKPDTSKTFIGYDVFGDARKFTDGLNRVENRIYDKMGRLITIERPIRAANTPGNPTGTAAGLIEYFTYDGLGQKTRHWTNFYGASVVERTDYDVQHRVVSSIDYGGYATTTTYSFDANLVTTGLGTFGGWVKATTQTNGHTATEKTNYFGRIVSRTDLGGHVYSMTFDKAARLTQQTSTAGQQVNYTYFNTGMVAKVVDNAAGSATNTSNLTSIFAYDLNGRRVGEKYINQGYTTYQEWDDVNQQYVTYTEALTPATIQDVVVAYDALGRMTSYTDNNLVGGVKPVDIDYQYDANGNVRSMIAEYRDVVSGNLAPQEYWYKYDSMNRFTTTLASFDDATNTIVGGGEIAYDAAGRRASLTTRNQTFYYYPGTQHWDPDLIDPQADPRDPPGMWVDDPPIEYTADRIETYTYTEDGYLSEVRVSRPTYNASTGTVTGYTYDVIARNTRDLLGRVSFHEEFRRYANGFYALTYSQDIDYNVNNLVTYEYTTTLKPDYSYVYYSHAATTYYYNLETTSQTYNGAYMGGLVTATWSALDDYNGNQHIGVPDSKAEYTYTWWDDAKKATESLKSGNNTWKTSTFKYDANGHQDAVDIADGQPRTIHYITDGLGLVMERNETSTYGTAHPYQRFYYFNGVRVGEFGNEGPTNFGYAGAIAQRGSVAAPPTASTFYAHSYADFEQSYEPINPTSQGNTDSSVTVRSGDTLQSIARNVWGDAAMWYLIAEANGLNGTETLVEGTTIKIPAKVANFHNTSDTFRVYDPNLATGDTAPNQAKPPPKNVDEGCGMLGVIIVIIIAVVVTIVTDGALSGPMGEWAAAVIGAAAGSVAGQVAAMAIGLQDEFDWSSVALSMLTAGVAQGLTYFGWAPTGVAVVDRTIHGVVANVITQGVAVATGAQDNFDWAGVAGAAVGGLVSSFVAGNIPAATSFESAAGVNFVSRLAGGLANAATRSLIEGSDFGDNVLSVLPDVVGSTIADSLTGNFEWRPELTKAIDEASDSSGYSAGYGVPIDGDYWIDNDLAGRSELDQMMNPLYFFASNSSGDRGVISGGNATPVKRRGFWGMLADWRDAALKFTGLDKVFVPKTKSVPAVKRSPSVTWMGVDVVEAARQYNEVETVIVNGWRRVEQTFKTADELGLFRWIKSPEKMGPDITAAIYGAEDRVVSIGNRFTGPASGKEYNINDQGKLVVTELSTVERIKSAAGTAVGVKKAFVEFPENAQATMKVANDMMQNPQKAVQAVEAAIANEKAKFARREAEIGHEPAVREVFFEKGHALPDLAIGVATLPAGGEGFLLSGMRGYNALEDAFALSKLAGRAPLPDEVLVFRGTGRGMELDIYDETGFLLSDAAQQGYLSTDDIGLALRGSSKTHDEWIDIWGDEGTYAQAHGEFGTELGPAFGLDRTFMSVTTDPGIADIFANGGGTVFSGYVPRSQLVKQSIVGATESEYLIRGGTNLLRPVKAPPPRK